MPDVFLKDPDAQLDYTVDWGVSFLSTGETISTSSWSVSPTGSTDDVNEVSSSNDSTTATITANRGRRGVKYLLTNSITTSDSRQDDRSIVVLCEER